MLRKKDLVKQFEILTKQEIINHQNSINATNLLLNKFEKRLDEILVILKKEVSLTDSRFITQDENFQRHKTQTLGEIKENKGLLRSVKWRGETIEMENEKRLKVIESHIYRNKEIEALHKQISFFREEYQKDLLEVKQSIQRGLDSLDRKCQLEREKLSLELNLKPSHIEHMEAHILQKVLECRIDSKGLVQEVIACKKASFIIQKKIENLYTIHERLRDKIQESQVSEQ